MSSCRHVTTLLSFPLNFFIPLLNHQTPQLPLLQFHRVKLKHPLVKVYSLQIIKWLSTSNFCLPIPWVFADRLYQREAKYMAFQQLMDGIKHQRIDMGIFFIYGYHLSKRRPQIFAAEATAKQGYHLWILYSQKGVHRGENKLPCGAWVVESILVGSIWKNRKRGPGIYGGYPSTNNVFTIFPPSPHPISIYINYFISQIF